MNVNFFKSIYNEDTIFHYTKASTAIDYILYNQKLRFSKAIRSNDPIESKKAKRGTVYFDSEVDINQSKEHHDDANELHNTLDDLENRFCQICFCKNTLGADFASEHYLAFKGHEELFGFTKLRMWDQYADKFTGVCIAFSKEKILSLNKDKFELIVDDVSYLSFCELFMKKIGDIQGNYLKKVGKDKYKEQLEKSLKESFFCKHLDYSGENELRIGTLFEPEKCFPEIIRDELILNQNMMLDITNCISAIFISSFTNDKQKMDLLEYANNFNVELIEMKWKHNSFEPHDYKKWIELIKNFEIKK